MKKHLKTLLWISLSISIGVAIIFIFRKKEGTGDPSRVEWLAVPHGDAEQEVFTLIPLLPNDASLQEYFSQIASNLGKAITDHPARWAHKKNRADRVVDLLGNGVLDNDVVLLQSSMHMDEDPNDVRLIVKYLDESDVVEYVRYGISEHVKRDTLLLTVSRELVGCSESTRFQRGYMCWVFLLRVDDQIPMTDSLYKVVDKEPCVYVNSNVFTALCKGEGRISLFDKEGQELDSMAIENSVSTPPEILIDSKH